MRITLECEQCGRSGTAVMFGPGGAFALEHVCDLPMNACVSGSRPKGPIHLTRLKRRNSNPHVWEPDRGGAF